MNAEDEATVVERLLAKLPEQALRRVASAAASLLALGGTAQSDRKAASEQGEGLYRAVACRVPGCRQPYDIFLRRSSYAKSFLEAVAAVQEFFATWFPRATRQQRRAVEDALARLSVNRCKEGVGAEVVMARVLYHLKDPETLFERAFPGYLSSGLAYVVLRQLVPSNNETMGDSHVRQEPGKKALAG